MRGEDYALPQGPRPVRMQRPSWVYTLEEGAVGRAAIGRLALVSTPCCTGVRAVSGLLDPVGEGQFSHTWDFGKQLLKNSSCFEMGYGERIYTMENGRCYEPRLFLTGGFVWTPLVFAFLKVSRTTVKAALPFSSSLTSGQSWFLHESAQGLFWLISCPYHIPVGQASFL